MESRWFDRAWYLSRNPDVAHAGIDPLAHYRRYGEPEGRRPSPWFDPAWYRAAYGIPADQSPLDHFLNWRATGRFLPCAALYPVPLLPSGKADIEAGTDPFDRYLTDTLVPEREHLPSLAPVRGSGLIAANYFAINVVGPFETDFDPALHYCRFGARAGAWPSDAFDPGWYRTTNPTALRVGIDPLLHYILEGEARGRRPIAWFDPAWYREAYAVPADRPALTHYLAHRDSGTVSPNPLFDIAWYRAAGPAFPPGTDPFAHYLVWGGIEDVSPSPGFDARLWRHRHMAPLAAEGQNRLPAAARNPLIDFFRRTAVAE